MIAKALTEHGALVIGEMDLVRSLQAAGIPCHVASDSTVSPILFSRYPKKSFRLPDFSSSAFIEALISIGQGFGTKMFLLCNDDRALLTISQSREMLLPYYAFLLPDIQTVESIYDKRQFSRLAQEQCLPVPATYLPISESELMKLLRHIPYPSLIKPAHREDWWGAEFKSAFGQYRKILRCDTPDELMQTFRKAKQIGSDILVQEYVEGSDSEMFNIDICVDDAHRIAGFYMYQKHRSYPIHAGTGSFVETMYDEELLNISRDVVERLKIRGFCNIQYKRGPSGWKILEVHPRLSIWSFLGGLSGVNLVELGYSLFYQDVRSTQSDDSGGRPGYRMGIRGMDIKRDVLAAFSYATTGDDKWTLRLWLSSLMKGIHGFQYFTLSDPIPFFADLFRSLVIRIRKLSGNRPHS